MARLDGFWQVATQQALCVGRSDPSPFLGDTDGHNVVFLLIDGVQDRGRRQQRDFMLAAAPAKQDTYPEFCHASILTPESFVNSNQRQTSRRYRTLARGSHRLALPPGAGFRNYGNDAVGGSQHSSVLIQVAWLVGGTGVQRQSPNRLTWMEGF